MESSDFFGSSASRPSKYLEIFEDGSGSEMSLEDWHARTNEDMESSDPIVLSALSPAGFVNVVDETCGSEVTLQDWEFFLNEEMDLDEEWLVYEIDEQGLSYRLSGRTSPLRTQTTNTEEARHMFLFYEEESGTGQFPDGVAEGTGPTQVGCHANRRRGGRRCHRVTPVSLTDEDVTPELRQFLMALTRHRERRVQQSRVRRNLRVRENENESVTVESSLADELFGHRKSYHHNSALEFEWLHRQEAFRSVNTPGLCQPTTCAYEAFRQFWDDEVLNHIDLESNRYLVN